MVSERPCRTVHAIGRARLLSEARALVLASIRRLGLWVLHWVDDVAAAIASTGKALRPPRRVRLIEQSDGALLLKLPARRFFAGERSELLHFADGRIVGALSAGARAQLVGSRLDIVLSPRRFVFRPLELPRRASEFLEGIVRAQIDRLTPWPPAQAAFGWSAARDAGGDRIDVIVAAAAREPVAALARAVAEFRAASVVFSAALTRDDGGGPQGETLVKVFEADPESERQLRRLRPILISALSLTGFAAVAAVGAWILTSGDLDARRLDLAKRLAERRVALISGRGSIAEEATAALARKKHETPAGVIVLESLSQALPDDTYLTELRVEDGKLQIAGITRDAPGLIRTIEQSPQFTHATFFAPTTRAPSEAGERFHIEAHIEPFFPAAP